MPFVFSSGSLLARFAVSPLSLLGKMSLKSSQWRILHCNCWLWMIQNTAAIPRSFSTFDFLLLFTPFVHHITQFSLFCRCFPTVFSSRRWLSKKDVIQSSRWSILRCQRWLSTTKPAAIPRSLADFISSSVPGFGFSFPSPQSSLFRRCFVGKDVNKSSLWRILRS